MWVPLPPPRVRHAPQPTTAPLGRRSRNSVRWGTTALHHHKFTPVARVAITPTMEPSLLAFHALVGQYAPLLAALRRRSAVQGPFNPTSHALILRTVSLVSLGVGVAQGPRMPLHAPVAHTTH